MDAARHLHQPDRPGLPANRLLRSVQAGWARAVCPALRDALSRGVCLSLLHRDGNVSRSRPRGFVSEERGLHHLRAAVSALLRALPDEAATVCEEALARSLSIYSGDS